MLQVASDRSVRGAVERSCTPQLEPTRVKPDDVAAVTKGDQASAFVAFASGLRASYDRYLNSGDPSDPARDGIGYSVAGLWLDDDEFVESAQELQNVSLPRLGNEPAPGCLRRAVSMEIMPEVAGCLWQPLA